MFLVLLLGLPGIGKGTLSQKLVAELGYRHFSTGKIFRKGKGGDTTSVISQGQLVSDDYVNDLVMGELRALNQRYSGDKLILDGYPRTIVQAEFLERNFPAFKVFYLTGTDEEIVVKRLMSRLLCEKEDHSFNSLTQPPRCEGICDFDGSKLYKRPDDTEEIIRRRIGVYKSSTQPLIDYYRGKGLLCEIDMNTSWDEIMSNF